MLWNSAIFRIQASTAELGPEHGGLDSGNVGGFAVLVEDCWRVADDVGE